MKIDFAGHQLVLHHGGVMFWPQESLLVVSDLHLEKGSHYAGRGYFLPPYDSQETLERLHTLCRFFGGRRLLILGDGFHDHRGYQRLSPGARAMFEDLKRYDPIWITGNHDAEFMPQGFAIHDTYESHGLFFRHQAQPGATAEISGHFHPKRDILHKGALLSRRCFIEDGRKLMMPAFGAYAGGLRIDDPAIASLFRAEATRSYLMGSHRLFALSSARV